MDENEKMNNPTQDDDTTVETTKPTADDGEAPSAPAAAPALDPAGLEAALKAYIAATNGATADDENDPAAGDTTDKPTKDEGEGDAPAKPDVLADITARRDAMEDGPAKADINTLLSMLDAANARADAAEDDTKPTEDEDDTSDDSSNQLNHDSAASIAAQVSQRVELCRLGDKLHLDGMESMPVMQAKKKVVHVHRAPL